jgi:hypothetical protein
MMKTVYGVKVYVQTCHIQEICKVLLGKCMRPSLFLLSFVETVTKLRKIFPLWRDSSRLFRVLSSDMICKHFHCKESTYFRSNFLTKMWYRFRHTRLDLLKLERRLHIRIALGLHTFSEWDFTGFFTQFFVRSFVPNMTDLIKAADTSTT